MKPWMFKVIPWKDKEYRISYSGCGRFLYGKPNNKNPYSTSDMPPRLFRNATFTATPISTSYSGLERLKYGSLEHPLSRG